jgi:hypothetical protein
MLELLLAGWLCLPLAPLNPIQQDTLDQMALHGFAGMHTANATVATGPELGLKYEVLAVHPLLLRCGMEYRFGQLRSATVPDGDLHQFNFSADAIYYRGTNRLTGYVGIGVVFNYGAFNALPSVIDSLMQGYLDDDPLNPVIEAGVGVEAKLGYRITLGLRFRETTSLEICITEVRPEFTYRQTYASGARSESHENFRNNSFSVTVGYIVPLLR